ncbi:MAG: hypothetical protein QXK12_00245 [Candidatus Nezhaarchaeales archaeon]
MESLKAPISRGKTRTTTLNVLKKHKASAFHLAEEAYEESS